MAREWNPNLKILELAVAELGELADEMVFVGGCTTGLLITDPAAPAIRFTQDVDAIVQVVSRAEYYRFSEKLRAKDFREDMREAAPLCRWVSDNVTLDVMPTDSSILGFGNLWYEQAIENSEIIKLPSGNAIQVVSAPYFLITKLEAFKGRGGGDYLLSHDIEDIVAVLDGRPSMLDELDLASTELKQELARRFAELLNDDNFTSAVFGHMPTDKTSQARVQIVLNAMKTITEM
jgi:hypothetical protein